MPITHKTRFFTSNMTDAPVMTPSAGGIIAVLDGCLLNGFNTKTLSSLSVTDGIATATVPSGHGYALHSVIDISGASISALNATQRILTVPDSNTFTFDATGVANGTATGTITAIMSKPTGWSKPFSGTNKAAYKSGASNSGFYFRVDDSGAYNANSNYGHPARGYESMTDIDTGSNPFPTTAQQANFYWRRSTDASGNREWALVADDCFFYLIVKIQASSTSNAVMMFGDIAAFDSSDAYACIVSGSSTFNGITIGSTGLRSNIIPSSIASVNSYSARQYNGSAGAVGNFILSIGSDNTTVSAVGAVMTDSYSVAGGHAIFRGGVIVDGGTSKTLRGTLPGFFNSLVRPESLIPANHSVQIIDGKLYMATRVQDASSRDTFVAISLDGWR